MIVIVLLWFFIEYIFKTKQKDVSIIGQSFAKPLNSTFNQNAIKKIQDRLVIPTEALEKIYTSKPINLIGNINSNSSSQSGMLEEQIIDLVATSSSAL